MENPRACTRVLGIVGSPREGGNTERLVDAVLAGARSVGFETEKLLLSQFDVRPCQGCLACYPGGLPQCTVHDDDMPEVADRMKQADIWILGTPVYCFGPTAQFKIYLDRWIAFLPRLYEGKQAATVIPLHMPADGAGPTLEIVKTMLRGYGIAHLGDLVFPELLHLGDLDEHEDYLEKAESFGRELRKPRSCGLDGEEEGG